MAWDVLRLVCVPHIPHFAGRLIDAKWLQKRGCDADCSLGHPALPKDNLNIGIVTFSTSDLHTNQMVDTMSAEAKAKGWTVENLNANGDPSQAIAQIKQLVTKKADAIIVTVFDSTGLGRRSAGRG